MRVVCLAGSANKAIALDAPAECLGLPCADVLLPPFSKGSVCGKRRRSSMRCSIRSRIGGSATGVSITDNCHDTVRR